MSKKRISHKTKIKTHAGRGHAKPPNKPTSGKPSIFKGDPAFRGK